MKPLSILFLLFIPLLALPQSQHLNVIASGGGYESNSSANLSLSYTVGEPVTETFAPSGSSIVLTQGFQQSMFEPVGIEAPKLNLNITAYPNPTASRVVIELRSSRERTISLQLFNMQGKKLDAPTERQALQSRQRLTVDLSGHAAGAYLLGLLNAKGERLHTIKVQKVR